MEKQTHNNNNYITTNCFMSQRGVFKNESPFLNNLLHTDSNSVVTFIHKNNQQVQHDVTTQSFLDIKNHNLFLNYDLNINTQAEVNIGSVLFTSFDYVAVYKLPNKPPQSYSIWYNQKRITAYKRIHIINLRNTISTSANVSAHLIKEANTQNALNTLSTDALIDIHSLHNAVEKVENLSTQAVSYVSNISPYRNITHVEQLQTNAHLDFFLHKAEHPMFEYIVNTTAILTGYSKFNHVDHTTYLNTRNHLEYIKNKDALIDKIEQLTTTSSISALFTPGIVEEVEHIITSVGDSRSYAKDIEILSAVHTVITQGQTDIKFGENIFISRTEQLTTTSSISALFTPGIVEEVEHNIQTSLNHHIHYKHTQIEPVDNSVITQVHIFNALGIIKNTPSIVHELITTTNIQRLYTPGLVETVLNSIETNSSLTHYIKHIDAQNILHNLITSAESEQTFIAEYVVVNQVISDANIRTSVIDKTPTIEHVVQTDSQHIVEKNIIVANDNTLLITNATLNTLPLKLANSLNELLTNTSFLNYYKDINMTNDNPPHIETVGSTVVYTYSNDVEALHLLVSLNSVQYFVDRLLEDVSNLLSTYAQTFLVPSQETLPSGIHNVASNCSSLVLPGFNRTFETVKNINTSGDTNVLYTPGLVETVDNAITSFSIANTYAKDIEILSAVHTVITQGQTDMVIGEDKFISRTENVLTYSLTACLFTPGTTESINNGCTTQITFNFYHKDKQTDLTTNMLDTLSSIQYRLGDNKNTQNVINQISTTANIQNLYTPALVYSTFVLDSEGQTQTYYKNSNTPTITNNIITQYNQTYNFEVYQNNTGSILHNVVTAAASNLQFDPIYTISLNKQSGVGGTNELTYINQHYITPTTAVPPTRNMYNHQGYYEESFTGDRLDWLAVVPSNSSTNKRVAFETSVYKGDNAMFLNSLYTNSTLWRLHAIVSSTHPITQFDISDQLITSQVITLSTSPLYMYLIDVSITDNMANYNPSGAHYEFIDCVTDKDAIITFKDTWVYKKGYALTQRISSDGDFTDLNQSTYNTNKTLYAQWTPRSIKVIWKDYAGNTLKTQNVYYEGSSDITPTVTTAPAGTSNSAQYTYTWPVNSYTITSEHTHREVITIQETRTVNKYTITWKNYVGTTLKTDTIDYGSTSIAPTGTASTTQYTYSWPKSSTTVTGAETIQETRITNKYTITWKNYAGTTVKTETINYGTTSTAPTGTTNTAQYTYSWPKASTTVIGNETIQETRVVNKYTINFINYAGTTVSTQNVDYGTTPTIPNNTTNNTQYTYSWPTINTVTQAHNYNEIRTINQYTITWKNYAGDIVLTDTYNYGTVVNAPIGTSNTAGYTYTWPKASTNVVGNETIQELRTPNTFTLTFDANGGSSPTPPTKVVTYNTQYGALATTSKSDYSFLGWFTAQTGGSKILSSTNMLTTNNHTLWAHWNPANVYSIIEGLVTNGQTDIVKGENIFISRTEIIATNVYMEYENQTIFTITLDKQSGTGGTNTIEGSTGINITPASITTPTRTNYTFLGYYNQITGGTKYINSNGTYNNLDSNTFIGNVTLYAQWSVVNRTAQWKADPATIGILADVHINNVIKGSGVSTYSAAQVANAIIKVKNHTVPPGWTYSTYTLSNLTSAVVGGSGNNIEIQATGDMTKTGTRVLTTKFTALTYNVNVNQNNGIGSSASVSQYTPNASTTTVINMTKGTRNGYRIIGWTLSGANNLAELSGHTITIPVYTNTIQPYGNLTITPIWALAMAEGLNEIVTDATTTYEAVHPITITLNKQSGTGGTNSITSVKGFYTDPTAITIPTRTGHTFKGYYTATNGVGTQRINNLGVFVNLTHNTYSSNTTLYAYWTINQYTLVFNSAGGSSINPITQNYNTVVTPPNDPTRTGYTFAGWSPAIPTRMPANNINLTAQWNANTYTISFNGNGGTSPTSKTIAYNNVYGSLTNSTRSGYQFIGWFTAITGGTKITANTVMNTASNHTLYAHWNPTQVKDIVNNIETVGVCTTDYVPAVYIITPSKDSNVNTFSVTPSTYSPKSSNQTISINRTFKTGYMENVLTLTRVQPYGGATPTISGNTITIPANSYGAFNLYQTSVGVPITVTFNADGGTTPNPTTKTVTYNTAIGTLPNTTRVGHTFDGWYTPTNVKVTTNTVITTIGGITLKAKWTPNTYFVNYDPVEDVLIIGDTHKYITYGDPYGQPPIFGDLPGYTIAGWKTAEGHTVTPLTIMNRAYGHTLYADWQPNEFDITLNPNTGTSGSKTKIAVVYNTSIEPFSTTMRPTKTGHTFKGFYTSTSGGIQRISNTQYVSLHSTTYRNAATLYAQWTPSTYSIYFNANGGTTPSPSSKHVTYGSAVGALPTTTKSGSTFLGWFTNTDVQITADTVWSYTVSHTLTAKWQVAPVVAASPTLTISRQCRMQGFFEICDLYLNVKNNDTSTATIMWGDTNPPTTNGGTVGAGQTKSFHIGEMMNNTWVGPSYYYAYVKVTRKQDSIVRSIPAP